MIFFVKQALGKKPSYSRYITAKLSGQRMNVPLLSEQEAAVDLLERYEHDVVVVERRRKITATFIELKAPKILLEHSKELLAQAELSLEISGGEYRRARQGVLQ